MANYSSSSHLHRQIIGYAFPCKMVFQNRIKPLAGKAPTKVCWFRRKSKIYYKNRSVQIVGYRGREGACKLKEPPNLFRWRQTIVCCYVQTMPRSYKQLVLFINTYLMIMKYFDDVMLCMFPMLFRKSDKWREGKNLLDYAKLEAVSQSKKSNNMLFYPFNPLCERILLDFPHIQKHNRHTMKERKQYFLR